MVLRPAARTSNIGGGNPDGCEEKKKSSGEGRRKGGKHKIRKARKEEIFILAGNFHVPDVMGY